MSIQGIHNEEFQNPPFSRTAEAMIIVLLIGQELWMLTAPIVLALGAEAFPATEAH
ncbi:MAG TPA: hypothetical protein VKM54_26585 [Myxococcota bacterium]|nr:hypothetical protein [Myxococcota bacterium]